MDGSVNMTVSPVMGEKGNKYAFVYFSDNLRKAEGKIPDCKIFSNDGYNEEEVKGLEEYMSKNLSYLKKLSSGVNLMKAFMAED
ncbi:MAG: hypothetical protein K5656_12440 [Lachnospiraceae bacterium]|nr:hypothetical protein [Lachnospiraceae bacterium]